jgi:hypothetical protein
MKAGDIKKFLLELIEANQTNVPDPKMYNIHDTFLLGAVAAYKRGDTAESIKTMVDAFITTEELTVHRRVAVLRMVRDVVSGISGKTVTETDKERLRNLLTAYFV